MSSTPNFWKPNTSRPGSSLDRSATEPILTSSPSTSSALPIHSQRIALLHALETSQFLIVVGETGSGKTTQLPQILYSAGWASFSTIAVTQPRRVAATSVAARVATELGVKLGAEVGYTIRFEDHSDVTTRIKYLTDGALFRECIRDPLLTRYSVVVVDEAHERGVYTDLLLGVLKKICRKRADLRVVVSSATIDARMFSDYLDDAKVLQLRGRSFPVSVAYLAEACDDYVQQTIDTIWRIHLTEPQGDILAFLTGREEIQLVLQQLSDRQVDLPSSGARMHLLPLHAGLSTAEQAAIFSPTPPGARKVVVATNIAEASITLDGVVYVVDCGLVKLRTNAGDMDTLSTVAVSRASAVQRAGRAGRTAPGKCFRLYTEAYFAETMQPTTPPELNRVDLCGALLQLKSLGVDDLVHFDWVPPAPAPEAVARALRKLVQWGALDAHARLTQMGGWMGELPLPPAYARVLVASAQPAYGCAQEMLSLLAMLQVTHPFYAPESAETQLSVRRFAAQEGDVLTLLNVYTAFTGVGRQSARWCSKHRLNFQALSRAVNIRAQLEKFLRRFDLPTHSSARAHPDPPQQLAKCLLTGLYANLARYHEASMTYTTIEGRLLHVHPTSVFFNRKPGKAWVVYGEATQQGDRTVVRDLMAIELDWVTDSVPGVYSVSTQQSGSSKAIHTAGQDMSNL